MKPFLLSLLLLVTLLPSCTVSDNKSPLGTSNLPLDSYTIDITRDTVLKTKKGAIIKLPAGTLESKNKQVTIQIREAFSIADMVMAGLVTKSNDDILSSGGMIYINAGEQNDVKIMKPIAVAIPTNYVQEGMQLYKGEEKEDGSINWVDPQPLQNKKVDRIGVGKTIYTNNCGSCHRLGSPSTGPDLLYVVERRGREYCDQTIWNSAKLIASGDPRAYTAYVQSCKTAMSAFPYLKGDSLEMLYEYLAFESAKVNPAPYMAERDCFDSCVRYNNAVYGLAEKRAQLIQENGSEVAVSRDTGRSGNGNVVIDSSSGADSNLVALDNNSASYYQFQITAPGWYNVDMLIKEMPGYEESILFVTASSPVDEPMNVYLVVPSLKVLAQGGSAGKEHTYAFYTKDGKLMLPQNTSAYILTMVEDKDQIYLGVEPFNISRNQTINVTSEKITKEEFTLRLKQMEQFGLSMSVNDSKNAERIRSIDKQLKNAESLKPKGCRCSCEDVLPITGEMDTTFVPKK